MAKVPSRRFTTALLACLMLTGLVVGISPDPTAAQAAASCQVGPLPGTETTWSSDGDDVYAQILEDELGLTLGRPRAGFLWRVSLCVAPGNNLLLLAPVTEEVSTAAFVDEQLALAAALTDLQARSQQPIPRIAPAVDQPQVVGLETWLSVDPTTYGDTFTSIRTAGDVAVTATATPVGLVWRFDNGTSIQELRCDGPGEPYSEAALAALGSPPCGWDWEHTTLVEQAAMSVAIEYEVSWTSTIDGAATIPSLVGRVLTPIQLRVGEIQTYGVIGEDGATGAPLPGELGTPPNCTLDEFAFGLCSDYGYEGSPGEDWGLPEECESIGETSAGFLETLLGGVINIGGELLQLLTSGEDLDDLIEAGRGVLETVEGISVSVVEVGGALWSCASWAAGEIYDRLPPELRFLADLTIGCSKIGTEMLAGVWSAVQSAAQAVDDPPAFIQEQIDLALAVKAEIEADPEGFARTMLGEVFDEELYNTNRNQWIGKMTCEAILIVLGTVAGGSGLIARFGPKIARLLDKIDEVLPGRVKRKDDDDDGPNLCGLNSFPTGTQVLMADGTRLAIELVEPGDSVVTYSTTDEVWRTQVVLDQWSHLDNGSMSTVTLADGSQVTATDHHQFWVANDGQWVELEDVTPGDLLLTPQGVTQVAAVHTSPPAETLVWELDTATDDTFTVHTGTSDVLVHNNDDCGSPVGLIGEAFENWLVGKYGGVGSFSIGGREFDGRRDGERWYEAKSGRYWDDHAQVGVGFDKFKSDMGDRFRIARENGATYELHSNVPIPQHARDWLEGKGIVWFEHLE